MKEMLRPSSGATPNRRRERADATPGRSAWALDRSDDDRESSNIADLAIMCFAYTGRYDV